MAAFPVSRRQFQSRPPVFDPTAAQRGSQQGPIKPIVAGQGTSNLGGIGDLLAGLGGLINPLRQALAPNIDKSGAEQTGGK